MKRYLSNFGKLEANHYRLIILLQFLVIAAFTLSLAVNPKSSFNTKALGSTFNDSIKVDIQTCLTLPDSEREFCAEMTGKKISSLTQDPKEQLKACLMYRPYSYIYDCQRGLNQ